MIATSDQALGRLTDPANIHESAALTEHDLGYEECVPMVRRGSMSMDEAKERRASIKAVMADPKLSPITKRRSIQYLMDGRRNSLANVNSPCNELKYCDGEKERIRVDNDDSTAETTLDTRHTFNQHCAIVPTCNEHTKRAEEMRPHCPHYERNCTLIAPCCGAAFGCRICHDDSPVLPPKIAPKNKKHFFRSSSLPTKINNKAEIKTQNPNNVPEENHHQIDRHAVVEIICRKCHHRQSSKTNVCISCNVQFGEYHCMECNLWMSGEDQPYHCSDCGFCRIGGKENFQHCHDCGICIDRSAYSQHHCKPDLYHSDCPVCQEYLFSSRRASHEMPCGHTIHWDCFRELALHDLRCPLCKKTADTADRMAPTWEAIAASIEMQPVPPSLARVVNTMCIDCGLTDTNRAWHFLGTQCLHCTSFNTLVDQIVMQGEKAFDFLKRQKSDKKKVKRTSLRRQSSRRSSVV